MLLAAAQAAGAMSKYGVHAVVANLLHTRKDQVKVLQPGTAGAAGTTAAAPTVTTINRPTDEPHIELRLVRHVVSLHAQFMAQQAVGLATPRVAAVINAI